MNDAPILLKWPGGKRAVINQFLPFIPETFQHYFEPFVGSGALFFTLAPEKARLSDTNKELINCYIEVRDHPEPIIEKLAEMKNTREEYYRIRESTPTEATEQAARFIYLMTLSFNGLYRVNLQGKFNVPYNHKTHLNLCEREKILRVSQALAKAKITHCDFKEAVEGASCGDFIYFDPPYSISSNPDSFVKYNDTIFSWEDHVDLAEKAKCLAKRGCHVLVSNTDHPKILELYQDFGFCKQSIRRFSAIAAKSKYRRNIEECLFYYKGETLVNEYRTGRETTQDCAGEKSDLYDEEGETSGASGGRGSWMDS